MPISRPTRLASQSGFTLLELMISLALLLVLTGAIIGGMGSVQKNYRGTEIRTALDQQMRATMGLMAQEIGQAGLAPSGMELNSIYSASGASGAVAAITQNITPSSTAQTVSYVAGSLTAQNYQTVIMDSGAAAEQVTILPGTQIYAVFQKAHSCSTTSPCYMYPHGIYPQGITFAPTGTPTYAGQGSYTKTSNPSLILFGDTKGNGTLSVVQYTCPSVSPSTVNSTDTSGASWGTLVRTEYDYNTATGTFTQASSSTLLSKVRGATTTSQSPADGCRFDYYIYQPSCGNWPMVISVGVTLVAESQTNDPQTGAPVILTKSFMGIQPRNIMNAYNMYSYNVANDSTLPNLCSEFLSIPTTVQNQINLLSQPQSQ